MLITQSLFVCCCMCEHVVSTWPDYKYDVVWLLEMAVPPKSLFRKLRLFLTHRWEPCQAESHSLTFINITTSHNCLYTMHKKNCVGGCGISGNGEWQNKNWTLYKPRHLRLHIHLYSDSQPCVRETFSASFVPQPAENCTSSRNVLTF